MRRGMALVLAFTLILGGCTKQDPLSDPTRLPWFDLVPLDTSEESSERIRCGDYFIADYNDRAKVYLEGVSQDGSISGWFGFEVVRIFVRSRKPEEFDNPPSIKFVKDYFENPSLILVEIRLTGEQFRVAKACLPIPNLWYGQNPNF